MIAARFPARARLRSGAAYRRVFDDPWRSSDACFTVLARANGLDYARLGLAVSRRSLPAATQRNRVKRVAREVFRSCASDVAGFDCVIVSRALRGCDNARLRQSLRAHFDRLTRHAKSADHGSPDL